MNAPVGAPPAIRCTSCRSELGPTQLACPACGRLVHAERLRELADEAERAVSAHDPTRACAAWRAALELLPQGTLQRERIEERIAALGREIDSRSPLEPHAGTRSTKKGWWAVLLGVFVFVASKGKLLVLGLTKSSTLLTMFVSFGAYWAAFGWRFAAGLIVSLYVHEMGHVAALRRFGIAASAPMFVPGLGAFVRLKQDPGSDLQDARIGLAGPIWGAMAALTFFAFGTFADSPLALALAHVGAWINLFNLLPVWQLDGARGMRALSRAQRWVVCAAVGLAFAWNGDGILLLVLLACVWRACAKDAPERGDGRTLAEYCGLVVVLAWLARQHAA